MQERPITVTIRVREGQTSLRVKEGPRERLVARLGCSERIHRRALVTILEGLSLWFQTTLHVALIADSEQIEGVAELYDTGRPDDAVALTAELPPTLAPEGALP